MEQGRGALRLLLAGMEPVLSEAMATALGGRGYRVDDEYSVDRVLRTLRRQPYDVVIIAGPSRYLNSTQLVRALRRDTGSDGFPAVLVVLPSVNRADRYEFDSAGADCVVALEGESLLGALVAGIDGSLAARRAGSEPHVGP